MKRRDFLKNSTVAVSTMATATLGIPTILPASVFGKNAPSNRITVGMIGTGRQGYGQNLQGAEVTNVPGLLDLPDAQVVAVCDVDSWRMEEARKLVDARYAKNAAGGKYKGCSAYADFRDILNRKDIDAVMISTPDHWHVPMGILAAKAKKHISSEKPLSLSVHQGRELVEAVRKAGVVNRTDSEFRSMRLHNHPVELVRNGHIGQLQRIDIVFPSDPVPVPIQADMPVPKHLNYDMWLGPAPYAPYTDMRVHTPFNLTKRPNWMRVSTYAQGMIANWGAHYFDMAQWANNTEYSGPVEVVGKGEFPKSLWNTMINFEVAYRYANGVELTCRQTPTSKPSIKYTGTTGWIMTEGYNGTITASDPKLLSIKPGKGQADFLASFSDKADFIASIKAGKPTMEPIEVGHRAISISQIGLIACQLEEKLIWNPEKELFDGNNSANALLSGPLVRNPWNV
jgi:myo-inositol 2-dehydrogenase/D-chiro-inositol 1-dehydrogenase